MQGFCGGWHPPPSPLPGPSPRRPALRFASPAAAVWGGCPSSSVGRRRLTNKAEAKGLWAWGRSPHAAAAGKQERRAGLFGGFGWFFSYLGWMVGLGFPGLCQQLLGVVSGAHNYTHTHTLWADAKGLRVVGFVGWVSRVEGEGRVVVGFSWMLRREGDNPILLARHASFCFGSWESHISGWERCHSVCSWDEESNQRTGGARGAGCWRGLHFHFQFHPGPPFQSPPSPLGSLSMASLCVCVFRLSCVDEAESPCGGLDGGMQRWPYVG